MYTKKVLLFFGIILLIFSGCMVVNKNKVYNTYATMKPKSIAIIVQPKNILERPASGNQFSEFSLFPDTIDKGSSLAYKSNSLVADFINTKQVVTLFKKELTSKKYSCQLLSKDHVPKSNTIKSIIKELQVDLAGKFDAILFVDYSPMFNRYIASKGVSGNQGHSLYYRYALFDLSTGQLLVRYQEVLHLEFYFKQKPSDEEMAKDIELLLSKDLQKNFPNKIGN